MAVFTTKKKPGGSQKRRLIFFLQAASLVSIYLFIQGFFTTKIEVEEKQQSTKFPGDYLSTEYKDLLKPKVSSIIIILIDALRFDFGKFTDTDITGNENWINNLPVFKKYLDLYPNNSIEFKFLADSPTTTYQRLHALLTGTIPTFFDAGSNFFAPVIVEDNLIYQLRQNNKKISFAGDNIWGKLFDKEKYFSEHSLLVESLDTTDIDSLDNSVLEVMDNIIENEWDVLIFHFLGVDHVGHTFGVNSHKMKTKLMQFNDVVEEVIKNLPEDGILLVFGDHGMTDGGGHGGDSKNEVSSYMFAYKNGSQIFNKDNQEYLNEYLELTKSAEYESLPIYKMAQNDRTISQIDIVPTISLLMRLPIPFSNIGSVIPEFFLEDDLLSLSTALRLNSLQIKQYSAVYKNRTRLLIYDTELDHYLHKGEDLYLECLNKNIDACKKSAINFTIYNRSVLDSALKKWVFFYQVPIDSGIFLGTIGVLAFISTFFSKTHTFKWRVLAISMLMSLVIYKLFNFQNRLNLSDSISRGRLSKSGFIIPTAIILNLIFSNNINLKFTTDINFIAPFLLSIFLLGVFVATLQSNNFLIFEYFSVMLFLQIMNSFLMIVNIIWKKTRRFIIEIFILALITRIRSLSLVCRDEYGTSCVTSFYQNGKSVSPVWFSGLKFLVALGVFSFLFNIKSIKPHLKKSFLWSLSGIQTLTSIYWGVSSLIAEREISDKGLSSNNIETIPNICLIVLIGMLAWRLFFMKSAKDVPQKRIQLYLENFMIIWQIIDVTQKPLGSLMLSLSVYQAISFMDIYDNTINIKGSTNKIHCSKKFSNIHTLFPNLYLLFLALSIFYSTGHQATFSTIQWDSGFIGLKSLNWYISPLLILSNTFGGYIVICLLVPLSFVLKGGIEKSNRRGSNSILEYINTQMLISSIFLLATMIYTNSHKRHLMTWAIFAPKFLFVSLSTVITYLGLLITLII